MDTSTHLPPACNNKIGANDPYLIVGTANGSNSSNFCRSIGTEIRPEEDKRQEYSLDFVSDS